jgi:hypothetical protein
MLHHSEQGTNTMARRIFKPHWQLPHLSLKDALFIGFCALFAVLVRVFFRIKLRISGRSMLPTVFFLMLARGSVSYPFAAIFAGLLAGSAAMFVGFAKQGPMVLLQYFLVAAVIDGLALLLPGRFRHPVWSGLTGALAGFSKFFTDYARNFLIGMDATVNLQLSLIEGAGASLFGLLAGLLLPVVLRRLRAYGVIV